jgi:type VI secretion system secreted protein Hcp
MSVEFYLKLDGIEGESEVESYKNQIKLSTFGWGASQLSSVRYNGGSGAGKVNPHAFSVSTVLDKSTTKLFKAICAGTYIKEATMSAVKAGDNGGKGRPYLTIDFRTLLVSHISIGAADEIPTVSLQFVYNAVKFEYAIQKSDGNLASTGAVDYDIMKNVVS